MLNALLLIVGLALILLGANALTDGASSVARRLNVSEMVVGLTIVAFGTSAPELVVSMVSAINGSTGMAIGNVVGSNIFNILMILGVTAAIVPLKLDKATLTRDIPFVLVSSLALCVAAADLLIDGAETAMLSRTDGLLLLLFLAIFMRYTFSLAKASEATEKEEVKKKEMPIWKALLFIILGLAGLVFGGQLFVDSATAIALALGVSETVVGLTIVSGGTSLPELATSVVAATKRKTDMAIGNVVGSCVLNVFFILGASATICPLSAGELSSVDYLMLLAASVVLWLVGFAYKVRTITRIEGVLMAAAYVGYISYLVYMA